MDFRFGHLHRGFHRLLHRSHLVAEGERAQRPPQLTNCYFEFEAPGVACGSVHRPEERFRPMIPSEEFRRHAAECQDMARFLPNPGSRAIWIGLAERWLRCAERYEKQLASTQQTYKEKLRRRATHRWTSEDSRSGTSL